MDCSDHIRKYRETAYSVLILARFPVSLPDSKSQSCAADGVINAPYRTYKDSYWCSARHICTLRTGKDVLDGVYVVINIIWLDIYRVSLAFRGSAEGSLLF